jgi:hypothetical protein
VVGSPGDAARLIYGLNTSTDLRVPVDANGDVRVDLMTAPLSGANIVMVECPGTIATGYITVTGTATGVPWEMYQTVTPDDDPHPYQQADGKKVFSIVYSLYDRHGNVAGNRQIHVRIVPQEGYLKAVEKTVRTNEEGKAMISYGPSDVAGIADIVAYAVDNESLTCSKRLEFVSTDPTTMLLSASPQTVASRDVKSDISALIRAKVVDVKGNPVADESVSFTITAVQNGTFVMTQDPAITDGVLTAGLGGTPIVASTDNTGFATVDFLPGAFTTDISNPRYSNLSVGNATVRASWKDQTRDITVSFRNYPYLSVKTRVEPPTVAVNDMVNVTVQLIGDGYALHSRPIDVVLAWIGPAVWATTTVLKKIRIVSAKDAAYTFIGQMDPSRDRVGLVSFSSTTTRDRDLADNFALVNTSGAALNANGANPLLRAIYEAVKMQQEDGRPDAVKAVIVMTDGDWNYDGSPLGHGTGYPESASWAYTFSGSSLEPNNYRYYDGLGGTLQTGTKYVSDWWSGGYYKEYKYCTDGESTNQNMSRFAHSNDVKLYAITFAYNPSSTVRATMNTLSTSTGGFYEHAPDGNKLAEIYDDIALKLQEAAGVNTTMSLVFKNVEVNNVSGYSDVFEYQPINGVSTRVTKYWQTNLTTVQDKDQTYPYSFDQTNDWADDEISFKVGDIYLNQAWETTFCLKITEEGNIDIFGSNSIIRFNGTEGQSKLRLPRTLVTAVKDLNVTALDQGVVNVTIVSATWDGVSFLVPTWELRYSGNESVVQNAYYQYSSDNLWWDGVWNHFDTIRCGPAAVNGTYSSNLLVEGVNGWYKIRVHAQEDVPGGASGLDTRTQPIRGGNLTQNKIKLI